MLSPCTCGEAAEAYLADDGRTHVVACAKNRDWQCFARVEASTAEQARSKWEHVEYDGPWSSRVPIDEVSFPPHWTERWRQPGQHNQINECCRSLKFMELTSSRSNSRQFKPDRYNFVCTCCGSRQMSLCVGTEGVDRFGRECWRPWWTDIPSDHPAAIAMAEAA